MCGRFALFSSKQSIINYYKELVIKGEIEPNYNIAPSMIVPVVFWEKDRFVLQNLKWGFVPFWSSDKNFINIRAETIAEKPSFKYAFAKRRCLIPANGFFEWKKADKQPYFVKLKERELFSIAGIWEVSKKERIKTFGIITTNATKSLSGIHNRMPVILEKENEKRWLTSKDKNELLSLLKPISDDLIEFYPVAKAVNSAVVNGENLIKRITP